MVTATDEQRFLEDVRAGEVDRVRDALAREPQLAVAMTNDQFGHGLPIGSTALHIAVRQGHADIIDALLAAGSQLDARNAAGRTPLHDALQYDNRMRGRLLDAGAFVDVCHAAFLDNVDRLRELVAEDPACVDDRETGLSPLGWACYGRAAAAATFLIDHGADPNGGELVCAAQVAGVEVGRLLIARGADVDALDQDSGFNALHAVLTTPYTDDVVPFVELLMEYGADVNQRTAHNKLPLDLLTHAATHAGCDARTQSLAICGRLLRDHGARSDLS